MSVDIKELVALAKAAAAEAANYQDRFAATDTEARRIVDIMERFLRMQGRVVYGGAAINAHLPPSKKFYDPTLYLPDYDFMTPDPLQDCADLIVTFRHEGFSDVEAKFGIHEGTYKVFVNYRAAADITYMPPDIYRRILKDAKKIDGIQYASVNYLRMNMYLELSRPAGMVSRWEKVYERLLLLNEEFPLKIRGCKIETRPNTKSSKQSALRQNIIQAGIEHDAVFLSQRIADAGPILMMCENSSSLELVSDLVKIYGLGATTHEALGELLPAHVDLIHDNEIVAVVFETVACHSYILHKNPRTRMGSLDLLIQMYYALYFAELGKEYFGKTGNQMLCAIQNLIHEETTKRRDAARDGASAEEIHEVFPLDCIGHQPTMPELKKAHRERVAEKRNVLAQVQGIRN